MHANDFIKSKILSKNPPGVWFLKHMEIEADPIYFISNKILWFLICFWNMTSVYLWDSQLPGKLGRVLNNCIFVAFWIPLLVGYFWWISMLSIHSILLILLKLLFSVTKPDSRMENTIPWLVVIKGLLLQKNGNIVNKVKYLKRR